MALKLNTQYPGRFDPVSTDYPQGKWRNRSSSTANDGGYLEEAHMNDIYGFFGALLRNAEIVPDGTVDTARKSQFYEALIAVAEKVADEAGFLKKSEIAQEWGDGEDVPLSQKFLTDNTCRFSDSDITVKIPSDFQTLQEAFDNTKLYQSYGDNKIVILIESGHKLKSGLILKNTDRRNFEISSEDEVVFLDENFLGVGSSNSIFDFINVNAPVLNTIIDAKDRTHGGFGYRLNQGSYGKINPYKGVINCQKNDELLIPNLYVYNSRVQANFGVFTGGGRGIWMTRGAVGELDSADVSNSLGVGLYVSRGSNVAFQYGKANSCGTVGVFSTRSMVMAALGEANGCNIGYQATAGGVLDAQSTKAHNCNTGYEAQSGGVVNARLTDSNATSRDYSVTTGGTVISQGFKSGNKTNVTVNTVSGFGMILNSSEKSFPNRFNFDGGKVVELSSSNRYFTKLVDITPDGSSFSSNVDIPENFTTISQVSVTPLGDIGSFYVSNIVAGNSVKINSSKSGRVYVKVECII